MIQVRRPGLVEPLNIKVDRQQKIGGTYETFNVYDIFESADGKIWMGLFDGEIVQYSPRQRGKKAWVRYTERDGLDMGEEPRIGQTTDKLILAVSNTAQGGVNSFDGQRPLSA